MKTILPIEIVTLGDDGSYHLFVSGVIDGQQCELLIDTGASHTIFDAAMIPKISTDENQNCEIQSTGISSGDLNCNFGIIKEFKLGELKRENWTVVIIDLSHVNSMYKRFTDKRVACLIGSDFLLKHEAIIDYKKRELVLRNIRKRK